MPLENLGHFLIRTEELEKTRAFYVDVLGLVDGYRPPFPFPGHWLYIGETPVVHVAHFRPDVDEKYYTDQRVEDASEGTGQGTGPFDHIAFDATDLKSVVARLEEAGIDMSRRSVPADGTHQIFIKDPNGIVVELDFPVEEAADFEG